MQPQSRTVWIVRAVMFVVIAVAVTSLTAQPVRVGAPFTTSAELAALLSDELGTGRVLYESHLTSANVIALWSGTCNASSVLAGDGTCAAVSPGATSLAGTGATVTASTPVIDVTQTWNNSGVTFTGIKGNFTSTASGVLSLMMDLQVGGVSMFSANRTGFVMSDTGYGVNTSSQVYSYGLKTRNDGQVAWSSSTVYTGTLDVLLNRDAAGILALRDATNAQTYRVYETYTNASNYERGALVAGANAIELAAQTAGTGSDDLDVKLTPAGTGRIASASLTTTGAAGSKNVVCVDTATGKLYASSTGIDCSN